MFRIVRMTEEYARRYVAYRYAPPYGFYNIPEEHREEALTEVLRPEAGREWFAVLDGADAMIGFYEFTRAGGGLELGLGLAPERTGRGTGRAFVERTVAFARGRYPDCDEIFLRVAEFNLRAIRTYAGAGFFECGREQAVGYGGPVTFIRMRPDAQLFFVTLRRAAKSVRH